MSSVDCIYKNGETHKSTHIITIFQRAKKKNAQNANKDDTSCDGESIVWLCSAERARRVQCVCLGLKGEEKENSRYCNIQQPRRALCTFVGLLPLILIYTLLSPPPLTYFYSLDFHFAILCESLYPSSTRFYSNLPLMHARCACEKLGYNSLCTYQ